MNFYPLFYLVNTLDQNKYLRNARTKPNDSESIY
jgi:hypothetical protein